MSFFTKSKQKNDYKQNQNRKRKASEIPYSEVIPDKNEEITSSEEDGEEASEESASSEDEHETTQEKKLRLAKIYLQEIEKEEKRRLNKDEFTDTSEDVIQKRLKEDVLKQTGRLRLAVADKYLPTDSQDIKVLKCKQHRKSITCLCIASDNSCIFSGSKDGNLVKWSLNEMKKVEHFYKTFTSIVYQHPKAITCMAISSDCKFLAVGDESNQIHIWDPENLTNINSLKGHKNTVTGLVFRRETHTLYSCSADKSVKVWSLDDMSYVESLYGHQDRITAIDSLYRERAITSGGSDCSIRIWKIMEESQLIYNGHSGSVDCVKLINEENFISGGDDGQICVWSAMKKKPLCTVKSAHGIDRKSEQPNWICSVAALLNTDLVASGSCNGLISLWKLDNNCRTIDPLFSVKVEGFVNCLEFSSDGKYLIGSVGTEHRFGRWNVINSAKIGLVVIPLVKKIN